MTDLKHATDLPRPWPLWRMAMVALCLVGVMLSAYLSWHHLTGGKVIGCGGGSGCDHVLTSQWSSIAGRLPVSGLAMGTYLALLVGCLFIGPQTSPPERRLAWGAMLILVSAAVGSAIWFTIVQKVYVGSFCPYCMATHSVGLVLAALVIWRAVVEPAGVRQSPDNAEAMKTSAGGPPRFLGRLSVAAFAMVGMLLAGTVVALQLTITPPPVYRGGQVQVATPAVEARAVPLVGKATAPHIVTLMFDYRCPHCQKLHAMLDEVISRYDGKIAFVLCPAPLNTQCNPHIARQVDEFKDSCDLAKLALAVWVAKREAFAEFDRWMFTAEPERLWHPRSLEAVRTKAAELVGQKELDAAAADPWVDRYLQSCVRVYGNTVNSDGAGNSVPKLLYGTRWVTPEPRDAEDLIKILQQSLEIPAP